MCSVICKDNYVTFPVNFERKIHLAETDCSAHTICLFCHYVSRSKMLFNVDRTTTKWYVKSNSSVYLKVMWTLIFKGKRKIINLSFLHWKTQYSRLLCNSKWNICLLSRDTDRQKCLEVKTETLIKYLNAKGYGYTSTLHCTA